MVYNGLLPPPPQHRPCLSFSGDGRYIGDTEELLSVFIQDKAIPSQVTDQGGEQPASGADTSAVPVPGKLTVKVGVSDRQVSVGLTPPTGIATDASGVQGQSVQRPVPQVHMIYA